MPPWRSSCSRGLRGRRRRRWERSPSSGPACRLPLTGSGGRCATPVFSRTRCGTPTPSPTSSPRRHGGTWPMHKRVCSGRRAVLVIDQLDAVSLASGRAPEMYPVVDELLDEAARFGVQVVLACRRYDIDNDQRLKTLADAQGARAPELVEVAPLTNTQVDTTLTEMGIEPSALR